MENLSPDILLVAALVGATLLVIGLALVLRGRPGKPEERPAAAVPRSATSDAPAPASAAHFIPQTAAPAPAPISSARAQMLERMGSSPAPQVSRPAPQPAAPAPRQPSYVEIALASAGHVTPEAPLPTAPKAIDYAGESTDAAPGASYAAIAVAEAARRSLGHTAARQAPLPVPNDTTLEAAAGNGSAAPASYAAIALATVGERRPRPAETINRPVIDYSDVPAEVAASASYAAIAVATAVRAR